MKERSSFTSRIGFVLAAAGSAVGLGNMWRFPYLAAKYGGGAFLITYVLLAVTFGFTLMITEVAMGRRTRMSCIEAFGSLNRRFAPLGWLAALIPVIIAPYYCVIGGWVVKYFADTVSGFRIEGMESCGEVLILPITSQSAWSASMSITPTATSL